MKLSLALAVVLLAITSVAGAQDTAGLFFHGTPPTVEAIGKAAGDATVSVEKVESVTRVSVTWPDVTVIIHIDKDWQRDEQLSGIRELLADFPARERSKPSVKEFLANLDRTSACWGTIIEPGYDRDGKVAAFFIRLIGPSGGFLFTHQSFYSSDGSRITGLQDDPETLH